MLQQVFLARLLITLVVEEVLFYQTQLADTVLAALVAVEMAEVGRPLIQ